MGRPTGGMQVAKLDSGSKWCGAEVQYLYRFLDDGVVFHEIVEHLNRVPIDETPEDVALEVLVVGCRRHPRRTPWGIRDGTPLQPGEKHVVHVERVDVVGDLQKVTVPISIGTGHFIPQGLPSAHTHCPGM